ncbi:MAG: fibronectin type III domain-containing protein [Candidatus Poribacteria bacterium]
MNIKWSYTLRSVAFITLIALSPLFLLFSGCGGDKPTMVPKETLKISDITVSVKEDKALIQWKTDAPADSQIEYGFTKSYGMSSPLDSTLKTEHSIELTGLQFQKTYHFRVKSRDESGMEAQGSDGVFATLAKGEKDPKPSEVNAVAKSDSATVTFITNESATGEVEYGEDTSYGSVAKNEDARVEHSVRLGGLREETTYHYRIKVTDLDGNAVTSSDFTFKTGAKPKESIVRYSITARQWQFSPATIRVTEGDKVILTIRSVDVPHGFGLDAFGINKVLNPGKDVVVEFIAKKKGKYPFRCTVPCGAGHANMKGTLIVEKKE